MSGMISAVWYPPSSLNKPSSPPIPIPLSMPSSPPIKRQAPRDRTNTASTPGLTSFCTNKGMLLLLVLLLNIFGVFFGWLLFGA